MQYEKSHRKFSWPWVFISIGVFIGIELFFGGFVSQIVAGRYVGRILWFKIEMLIMLASYFAGGLVVGLLSPGIRILEPAIGAFLAVLGTLIYSFFTPMIRCFGFSGDRALIGGAIVFVLALLGADVGERIAARLGNRASKDYANR